MTAAASPKGLIVGMANDQSIAWGCAKAFRAQGAELAVTYATEKVKPYIESLVDEIQAPIFMPMDVTNVEQMDAVFAAIAKKWGKLDFVLHSVAFAPGSDLHGRVLDSSPEGFKMAMDVSCHSLIRVCKRAEPLMKDGGAIITMSYYGAEKVIDNYNMMGPVKAALEASVRYLSRELGASGIRINALSPGPVMTRAASGLSNFDSLIEKSTKNAPLHSVVTIDQIGEAAAFLASPKAQQITGQIIHVDNGYNVLG